MKVRIAVFALTLACIAAAQTPSVRLNKLLSADSMTVRPVGREPFSVFSKPRVRDFLKNVAIETDTVRGFQGGKVLYEISFHRSTDKNPMERIKIREGGVWCFWDKRDAYGEDARILDWLKKAEG